MYIILLLAPAGTDGPVIWLIRVKVAPPGVTVERGGLRVGIDVEGHGQVSASR